MYSYKRRDASAVDGHGSRARRVCLAERRRSEVTFVAGWAFRQAWAALVRLSNIRLRYVKKTPYLPFLGRSSVGRSVGRMLFVLNISAFLLGVAAAAKSAFSLLPPL